MDEMSRSDNMVTSTFNRAGFYFFPLITNTAAGTAIKARACIPMPFFSPKNTLHIAQTALFLAMDCHSAQPYLVFKKPDDNILSVHLSYVINSDGGLKRWPFELSAF